MRRVWLWWSSGKDSAWALHRLKADAEVEVERLITTISPEFDRVAMHGTRTSILRRQAEAVGLPIELIELPFPCSNEDYEASAQRVIEQAKARGVEAMAFGDLALEDVRDYRIRLLDGSGVEPIFPIWGESTESLAREMVDSGVEAYLTCVDPSRVPAEWAGRRFDRELLNELPGGVDPCGENGEFHSCVVAGPMLRGRIPFDLGEVVTRDGFVFADLVPRN